MGLNGPWDQNQLPKWINTDSSLAFTSFSPHSSFIYHSIANPKSLGTEIIRYYTIIGEYRVNSCNMNHIIWCKVNVLSQRPQWCWWLCYAAYIYRTLTAQTCHKHRWSWVENFEIPYFFSYSFEFIWDMFSSMKHFEKMILEFLFNSRMQTIHVQSWSDQLRCVVILQAVFIGSRLP